MTLRRISDPSLKCIAGVRHDIAPGDGTTFVIGKEWHWITECPRCGTKRTIRFKSDGSWRQLGPPLYAWPTEYRKLLSETTARDAKNALLQTTLRR